MDHFEEICNKYYEGDWESYRSFVPPGIPNPMNVDEYYRIPVYKGECMVILMLWGPGALTAIHDHGGTRGRVKVLKGKIREERYHFGGNKLDLISINVAVPGELLGVEVNDIHAIINEEKEMSVSLHVYDTSSNSFEGTVIYDAENKRIGVLNKFASRASWREKPEAFSSIIHFSE
jgi:predicted metal-dependent enzyme (double-stranded beta helix superfamily)